MYCPQCSQQQISIETRFCPRCGFQLDALKKLLTENQHDLSESEINSQTQLVSTRKRDILLGATIMLVAAMSIVLLMVSSIAVTPWQAVIIPLLLAWIGIVSAILLSNHAAREITNLFSKDASRLSSEVDSSPVTQLNSAERHTTLPPVQSEPVSSFGLWQFNTSELLRPMSITEHTTNSLNKKVE